MTCAFAIRFAETILRCAKRPKPDAGLCTMDERKLERLHRRLVACSAPQAIIIHRGKFDMLAVSSPRLVPILQSPVWGSRVLGVFSPDVPLDVLRNEVHG
jgi:hypothetical protein